MKIFFNVLNNPKGIKRDKIAENLNSPRTTIFDNLQKLEKRTIYIGNGINIPYVKSYTVLLHTGRGRPCVLWFVPKYLRNQFLEIILPTIEVKEKYEKIPIEKYSDT